MQDSLSSLHTQTKKKITSQALFLLVTDLRVSLFSASLFHLLTGSWLLCCDNGGSFQTLLLGLGSLMGDLAL